MSLLSLCRHTMSIQRPTASKGAVGGVQKSFPGSLVYSAPCTVQPVRKTGYRMSHEFDKLTQNISHVIYTPTPLSLQTGDRAVINGTTYVIHAWGDQADRGQVFAIYAERKD